MVCLHEVEWRIALLSKDLLIMVHNETYHNYGSHVSLAHKFHNWFNPKQTISIICRSPSPRPPRCSLLEVRDEEKSSLCICQHPLTLLYGVAEWTRRKRETKEETMWNQLYGKGCKLEINSFPSSSGVLPSDMAKDAMSSGRIPSARSSRADSQFSNDIPSLSSVDISPPLFRKQ